MVYRCGKGLACAGAGCRIIGDSSHLMQSGKDAGSSNGVEWIIRTDELRYVIVIQVSVRAKPDDMERLEQTLRLVVAEARQAAGCIRYDCASLPTTSVKCSSTRSSTPTRPSPSTKGTRSKEDRRAAHTSSKRGHRSSTSARPCSSRVREDGAPGGVITRVASRQQRRPMSIMSCNNRRKRVSRGWGMEPHTDGMGAKS